MAIFKMAKTVLKSMLSKPATLMYPIKAESFIKIQEDILTSLLKTVFTADCARENVLQAPLESPRQIRSGKSTG